MPGEERAVCAYCGEPVDESDSAECNTCFRRFHLRLRKDSEGKDCGEVWVNERYLSLEYACFSCLRGARADVSAEPPVGEGH